MPTRPALARAEAFARADGLQIPILLSPMAGAAGALLMSSAQIRAWTSEVRAATCCSTRFR